MNDQGRNDRAVSSAGPDTVPLSTRSGPKVSLVIPTYDRAGMLSGALDSVAASKDLVADEFEVVVVDNGSRDETRAVVEARITSYPLRLRYLFEARPGAIHAYNRGWRAARGELIVFMDDDQEIEPGYLGRVQALFQRTGADVLGGRIRFRDYDQASDWLRRRTEIVGQIDLGPETRELTLDDMPLKGGNLAARRCLLEKLGGFAEAFQIEAEGSRLAPGFEDDFQTRARAAGGHVFYSPELKQFNRFTTAQLSKAYWRRHAFDLGRGDFRLNAGTWRSGRLILGVPAWLFKKPLQDLAGFLLRLPLGSEADRFDREREVWYAAGLLYQAWHQRGSNAVAGSGSSFAGGH